MCHRATITLRITFTWSMVQGKSVVVRSRHVMTIHDHWLAQIYTFQFLLGCRGAPLQDERNWIYIWFAIKVTYIPYIKGKHNIDIHACNLMTTQQNTRITTGGRPMWSWICQQICIWSASLVFRRSPPARLGAKVRDVMGDVTNFRAKSKEREEIAWVLGCCGGISSRILTSFSKLNSGAP